MVPRPYARVRVELDVPVSMRDGVVLRANVYRPDDDGAGTFPVLLTRLPYGKDLPLGSNVLDPVQTARRGYIVAIQDVRGTFTSEGDWFPLRHEGADGADTVAWAAGLPGANGSVGLYGASYFGFTQWAAAGEAPGALRAMAPMIAWDHPDDGVASRGGVLELGLQGSWHLLGGLDQLARRNRGNPQAIGRAFYALVSELNRLPDTGYSELPLERFGPLARLGLDEPVNYTIANAGDPDAARPGSALHAYERMNIPMLHIGGWYDVFLNGTLRNFTSMRALGRGGQHLLVGPWTHGNVSHVQGDLDFGFASSGVLVDLQSDLMTYQLRFFDRWLKDVPHGFDTAPAVKYFVMGANVWKSADTWPPAGVTEQRWYLHSDGRANGSADGGTLSREQPESEPADTFVYDPVLPVPTIGGATLMHPLFRAGPRDQRPIEQREDVLVYTSAPLEAPLEVTGPVRVILHVATDAPDTDFVARLVDVYPDGRAITVTDGITRMRFRNGRYNPAEPLSPGQPYQIEVDLWSTALVLPPGHRIRVDVTSSSFPRWERNLNTGADNATTTEMRLAQQTILHDSAHPSYLVVSIMPPG